MKKVACVCARQPQTLFERVFWMSVLVRRVELEKRGALHGQHGHSREGLCLDQHPELAPYIETDGQRIEEKK